MNQRPDALTVALTGQLFFVLVAAAILALIVSWLTLRRYRSAVSRSMRRRGFERDARAHGLSAAQRTACAAGIRSPLSFHIGQPATAAGTGDDFLFRRAKRRNRLTAAIYAVAGICFAATMTAAFLRSSGMEFLPLRFLFVTWANCWPVILTIGIVSIVTRRARMTLLLCYFSIGAAVSIPLLAKSPDLTTGQLAYLWLDANGIPSLLLLLFLNRRIRAVGPLVMVLMLIGVAGAGLFVSVAGANPKLLRAMSDFTFSLGVGPAATLWAMHLLGFALFSVAGWLILGSLRQLYQRKQMSERAITVDAIWLLFAIANSMGLVFHGPTWIFSGFVAFGIFELVAIGGFRALQKFSPRQTAGPRLLLLRVFALGRRSEVLYDSLGKYWRNVGSIQMIAGPDLATTTIEPHEFLEFLSGKLSRRFVDSGTTLDLRMTQMDLAADGDGQFRVTEFFCHDDTWKLTLARLADESDAVLMDLRGFSQNNAGCVFEINELFNLVSLARVVFVIDASTDQTFLRQTMQQAWRQLKERSPNRRPGGGTVSLGQIADGRALLDLLRALCAAARVKPA